MKRPGKHWTSEYAGKILDEADRANSDRMYAKAHGIKEQRLWWWRRRLDRCRRRKASGKMSPPKVEFVEARAKKTTLAFTLEVQLTNGRQFRISDQTEAKVVGRLADALEGRC